MIEFPSAMAYTTGLQPYNRDHSISSDMSQLIIFLDVFNEIWIECKISLAIQDKINEGGRVQVGPFVCSNTNSKFLLKTPTKKVRLPLWLYSSLYIAIRET